MMIPAAPSGSRCRSRGPPRSAANPRWTLRSVGASGHLVALSQVARILVMHPGAVGSADARVLFGSVAQTRGLVQRGSADEEQVGSKLEREAVERTQLIGESSRREVTLRHPSLAEWKLVTKHGPLEGILGAE